MTAPWRPRKPPRFVTNYTDGSDHNFEVADLHKVTPSDVDGTAIFAPEVFHDDDITVVLADHEKYVVDFIESYPIIAGCVAWLTNRVVLQALATRDLVGIIVQKEDFLRPDLGDEDGWKSRLRTQYGALRGTHAVGWGAMLSYAGPGSYEEHAVRCMGIHDPDAKKKALPRMHHKFLIGCRRGPVDEYDQQTVPRPAAVWTGSFNLSFNATMSRENAVIIRRPSVADQYMLEYQELLGLSEPLDWESPWVQPEFRYGT